MRSEAEDGCTRADRRAEPAPSLRVAEAARLVEAARPVDMSHDFGAEGLELSLIQADANNALRALLAHRDDPSNYIIGFVALPVASFVAEETFNYFSERRRNKRLGSLEIKFFKGLRQSLKKVRARLKLFDDNDTGSEILSLSWLLFASKAPCFSLIQAATCSNF